MSQRPSIPGEEMGTARYMYFAAQIFHTGSVGARVNNDRAIPTVCQGGGDKYATGAKPKMRLKLPKQNLTIGTWNVRSLREDGKMDELEYEMEHYTCDILGISEMRWLCTGEMITEMGHKVWWSGDESKHEGGVGFLLHKRWINTVIECEPISKRLIRIRISSAPRNLTIIQAYAPTSGYSDEEVEDFYSELELAMAKIPKSDIRIIQGDWNAQIGSDAYGDWSEVTGKFAGRASTNERGFRLLEFAKMHNLVVSNTRYRHKMSRRITWTSPDGLTRNQIDYIMIDRKCATSINGNRTRSFPGADIGSDHNLVMMTLKLKLKKLSKPKSLTRTSPVRT